MTTHICSAPLAPLASDFVIVHLRGGDVGEARDAICVDCDLGARSDRAEWSALVARSLLDVFLYTIKADVRVEDDTGPAVWTPGGEQIGEPVPWDGAPFGDGNGGTVAIVDGEIEGTGLNADALPEPRLCGKPATTERSVGGVVAHLCAEHATQVDEEAVS